MSEKLYNERQEKLQALEEKLGYGFSFTDQSCDDENVSDAGYVDEITFSDAGADTSKHDGYWAAMVRSQAFAAGERAREYDLDINDLLGEVIY